MIRRIGADRPSFRTLEFGKGLNLLLADRGETGAGGDTRRGAGKTSLVELIHFLCGGDAPPGSPFRSDALRRWRFEMELEVGRLRTTVARSAARAATLEVSGTLASEVGWPHRAPVDGNGTVTTGPRNWEAALADHWFGLAAGRGDSPQEGDRRPSFGSLFPYFARRAANGGFAGPIPSSARCRLWDRQLSLSCLLGLDWTISRRFQRLRERENGLRGLKQAVRSGVLDRYLGEEDSLRTALTVSRAHARKKKEHLAEFRVSPDHEDLVKEADDLTVRIGDLQRKNTSDAALLREMEYPMDGDVEDAQAPLQQMFREAGVLLPGTVRRRFEETNEFHRRVVENHRSHMSAETASARARIASRRREMQSLDERRGQIMRILESAGALAEYTALREEVGRLEAQAEALEERLRDANRLERLGADLKAERARLRRGLLDDLHERGARVRDAVHRFERLSQRFFGRAGSLTIGAGDDGPEFGVEVPSGPIPGITPMQIVCFDLMLMELLSERRQSPGFLVHDSHLFDGVDERQVARALQLGAERANECGFQYIVMLNADAVPEVGFDPEFAIEDYILEVRLTDAREDGGLFGVRFD